MLLSHDHQLLAATHQGTQPLNLQHGRFVGTLLPGPQFIIEKRARWPISCSLLTTRHLCLRLHISAEKLGLHPAFSISKLAACRGLQ